MLEFAGEVRVNVLGVPTKLFGVTVGIAVVVGLLDPGNFLVLFREG